MKQIRNNVFETNSSSTHSMTICMKEDIERFKKGELLFQKYQDKFVETESVPEEHRTNSHRYLTYEQWSNKETDLDEYYETFTTPKGEEVVIFGEYGCND